jgi:hypothetical protein
MLSKLYPEYDWLPWKFEMTPKNYWSDVNNVKKFMDWAAKQLKIKEFSDWQNVKIKAFIDFLFILNNNRISPN